MRPNIYVSVDIEADGPIPGDFSMLSLGAATKVENQILTFSRNLERLPSARQDAKTLAWWETQPEAWAACHKDPVLPHKALEDFSRWLGNLPGKPVFVGYPATYDFMFVHWYMIHFIEKDPFSFSGLDLKTLAMCLLDCEYTEATKKNHPKEWYEGAGKHTHSAVEDAVEQLHLFHAMRAHRGEEKR